MVFLCVPAADGRYRCAAGLSRSVGAMAFTPAAGTSGPDNLDDVLLAVELELMRTPAMARLNGGRRKEISLRILEVLHARGTITNIPELAPRRPLRAA